jgi:hypothetical protein
MYHTNDHHQLVDEHVQLMVVSILPINTYVNYKTSTKH